MCNVLIAPVKNENSEVILFILNFDELSQTPDNKFAPGSKGLKQNKLLQQIGMPFISSIFTRTPTTSMRTAAGVPAVDPFNFLGSPKAASNQQQTNEEQMPLNQTSKTSKRVFLLLL